MTELFEPASVGGAVGPAFVWNILNYGRIKNAVRQQQALFEEAVFNYQDTVLKAQREAEDSIVGFLKTQDQTEQLQLAVKDIQELNSVLLTQANAGATDFNRVFVVQAATTAQQNSLAASQGEIAQNLIRIYRALGGGWQIRLADCNVEMGSDVPVLLDESVSALEMEPVQVLEPASVPVDQPASENR